MAKTCKKCGYERKASDVAPDYECPKCGAVYAKVEAHLRRQRESEKGQAEKNSEGHASRKQTPGGFFSRLFKKEYPILKAEMLQPANGPVTTTKAKQVYREWMLRIRFLDKGEISEHVKTLAEEMRNEGEYLQAEVSNNKEAVKDAKAAHQSELQQLRSAVAEQRRELSGLRMAAKDPAVDPELAASEVREAAAELDRLISDLDALKSEDAKEEIEIAVVYAKQAQERYDAFRKDKRDFLVRYINKQVHGVAQGLEEG